jgi:hypothetical protein
MVGSFAAALGPACLFFLRPILAVGCGGGSYLGFSFYATVQYTDPDDREKYVPSCPCRLFRPDQADHRRDWIVDCPSQKSDAAQRALMGRLTI